MEKLIPASHWLKNTDIRINGWGDLTGANGNKSMTVTLTDAAGAPTTETIKIFPTANYATGKNWDFVIELMHHDAAGVQRCNSISRIGAEDTAAETFIYRNPTLGLDTTTAITVQVIGTLVSGSDSITQDGLRVMPY